MRKQNILAIILLPLLMVSLVGCSSDGPTLEHKTDKDEIAQFQHSKDGVDKFYHQLSDRKGETNIPSIETYNNVTTDNLKKLGVSIFKDGKDEAYLKYYDDIYEFAAGFGGYGFINAVVCDYDNNGISDILYTYSFGSGTHRSEVAVFDLAKFKVSHLFSTFDEDDLIKSMSDLILEKRIVDDKPVYEAYTADLTFEIVEENAYSMVESAGKKELFKVVDFSEFEYTFISTKVEQQYTFTIDSWRIASFNQRGALVTNFLLEHNIIGLSYKQLVVYLGEPDIKETITLESNPPQFGGYILTYYLSDYPQLPGYAEKKLWIQTNYLEIITTYSYSR